MAQSIPELREQLILLRDINKWNDTKLSAELGVSKGYVSKFLNRRSSTFSEQFLTKIARLVKASSLSTADQKRQVKILTILDNADDIDALRAAITFSPRGRT